MQTLFKATRLDVLVVCVTDSRKPAWYHPKQNIIWEGFVGGLAVRGTGAQGLSKVRPVPSKKCVVISIDASGEVCVGKNTQSKTPSEGPCSTLIYVRSVCGRK